MKLSVIIRIAFSTLFFYITMFSFELDENENIFIDLDVKQKNELKEVVFDLPTTTYHLFSHGRSGELLLNGKWLKATEIVHFIKRTNKLSSEIQQLNIYGCEFAKGKKGRQAIAYIEKSLNIKVNASTNITGKDGDWLLEVGNYKSNSFINYQYNLQNCPSGTLVAGTGDDEDFDGDGICNLVDIDDDNDGILDAVESPNCFYTADEISIEEVTTSLTNYSTNTEYSFSELYDGVLNNIASLGVFGTEITGETVYQIEMNIPVELSGVKVYYQYKIFDNGAI